MATFEPAFEHTMRKEGGYKLTNIANDRGGQTYAGIARKPNPGWAGWGFIDRGETPPTAMVRDFYRANYWDKIRGDEIESQVIAATVYDFAVNAGPKTAAKLMQIVVGVAPDGEIGQVTMQAVNASNQDTFRMAYALAKIKRYHEIVTRDATQMKFIKGWIARSLEGLA